MGQQKMLTQSYVKKESNEEELVNYMKPYKSKVR